jgi:hypothetical protein
MKISSVGPGLEGAVELDVVESTGMFAEVDALDAMGATAVAPPGDGGGTVDAAWREPPPAHRARPIDFGAITGALARVAGRSPSVGEAPAEARMREIAARYLALRLEVAEGVARITIG